MKAKDFRAKAWESMSGKWGTFAVLWLLVSLTIFTLGLLSVTGVGLVGLVLVAGPLTLSVTMITLKAVRGFNVIMTDAFLGFRNFTNSFLLILINEILIYLWTLLFIIPGIVKSYAYSMSYYILADNPGMDPNQARLSSQEMMTGNKWRLFCLDCSFMGWYILCILTFGILAFWVAPYRQCAHAAFYEELVRERNERDSMEFNRSSKEPSNESDTDKD